MESMSDPLATDDENDDPTERTGARTVRPPPDHPRHIASTANLHFENDERVSGEVVFDIDEAVAKALKIRSDDDDDDDDDDEEDYQKAFFVFGEGYDPIDLTSVLKEGSDDDNEDDGSNTQASSDGRNTNAGGSSNPTAGGGPSSGGEESTTVHAGTSGSGDEKGTQAADRLRASVMQLGKQAHKPFLSHYNHPMKLAELNRIPN